VDEGIGAKTDDEGEPLVLEPTDEFSAPKAGIGQEQGGGLFGQQAGYQSAHPSFQFVLAMMQAIGVIGSKSQGQGPCFAGHCREKTENA
jgi:hypothetical protein